MKKGQLTFFMIIGVLLLFLAAFVFYGMGKESTETKKTSSNPVENYIDRCIESTAGYGLYLLGIHGGRIYEINGFINDYYNISYAIPLIEDSKTDLKRYIDENLNSGAYSCIKDLKVFSDQYEKIEVGKVNSTVIFADEVTLIKVTMPIVLQKGNAVKKYDSFDYSMPVRYKKIHNFIESISTYKDKWPVKYITESEFNVHFIQYGNQEEGIYIIIDKKSKISNKDYVFLSAIRENGRKEACFS